MKDTLTAEKTPREISEELFKNARSKCVAGAIGFFSI
jgi:hypothetical protein